MPRLSDGVTRSWNERANSPSVSDFHTGTLVMTLKEIKVRSIATLAGGYAIILLFDVQRRWEK